DTASSLEELREKEKMNIQKYNSHYIHGNGYNMTYGGEGNHGYIFTEEDKKKMSEGQRKRFENPEEKEKLALQSRNYWNDNEEAKELLDSYGVKETGLEKLIHAAYDTLGLQSYLTAGEKEVRAWTIRKGFTAPQAAGVIHTDFERGFIRAETIAFPDYIQYKGESGSKEAGKMRLEGKDYVVRDGDVMHFRFNV
ncbi:MAG: DUF933 domain-containing protein, partial [Betaproteobacteria bacterium]|nr:DUF933 domain-containing protein [Betaproteobacteria bacterium]